MKLNSKIYGNSPRQLIIVHGLFGSLDNWNTLGKKYAEYFTTHLIDLRNHGRSPHSNDVSHLAMSNDLLEYMNDHHIETASFIGHSLGGKVVMEFTLRHPHKVDKLIVADMAPKSYPPHHQDIIKGLDSINVETVESRSEADERLAQYIPQKAVRQFLLKNIYRDVNGNYDYRFNLQAIKNNYEELVTNHLPNKTYDGPVLFLRGEYSNYILDEDIPTIHHYFPKAIVETVPKSGHWLHAENSKVFFEKSLRFLLND